MKIKNETQYEALSAKLSRMVNDEGLDENSAAAIKMQDALAQWEEYEEAMEYRYEGAGMYEYLDSEYQEYPTPSDADSGL